MAANDFTYARTPQPTDLSVVNHSGGADIAAGLAVLLDVANLVPTEGADNVIVAIADSVPYGVAVEKLVVGKMGRVATSGIVVCQASAANGGVITANDWVQCDTAGQIKTSAGAGKATLGIALGTTAAQGDNVRVKLHIGQNT